MVGTKTVRVRAKWDLWVPEADGHFRQVLKGREVEVSPERADEMLHHGYAELLEPEQETPR